MSCLFRAHSGSYITAAIASFVLLSVTTTTAVAKNWADGTGVWNLNGNWSPAAVPVANEAVNIVFTDGAPRTVTYNDAAPSLGLVSIDLTGAGMSANTLSIPSNFNLTAAGLFVGGYNGSGPTTGRGAIDQMNGTVTASISPGVILGHGAGSSGTYTLGGSGTLNSDAGSVYVGYNGTGTFNQNAGTVTINNNFLDVGRFSTSTGNYNLVSGSLTVREEYIGDVGTAYFTQTGGTNTVAGTIGLILGYAAGSNGSYAISGGSLTVGNNLVVGNAGTGTMTIGTGGSVYVTNNLSINSSSNLNFNGGTLRFSTATGLDRINFTSGTVQIPGQPDTIHAVVPSLFGAAPVITAGKALIAEGGLNISGSGIGSIWTVQGGKLTVTGQSTGNGSLQVTDGGSFISTSDVFMGTAATSGNPSLLFTGIGTTGDMQILELGTAAGGGSMFIADGAVVNSVSANVGEVPTATSVVTVTGAGTIWHSTEIDVGDDNGVTFGLGILNVQQGGLVDVGSIAIGHQGAVNLNGGTLRVADPNAIVGLDRINFNYGTIELTGDRTVGSDANISSLFGVAPAITAREGLKIDGTATLSSSLTLDGGTFTAGGLAGAASNLHLIHGTLNVTNQALTVGSSGNLASSLDLASDMNVNSTLGITNQGLVTGDGQIGGPFANATPGEVRVASNQSLKFTGSGNTNAGRINLYGGQVEFTQNLTNSSGGLVSGNGTLLTAGLTNQGVMNFSGLANIVGDVTNALGGKIISTGGGPTTFFDDVTNQGEIHTSPGGFTVFFGSVSGAGSFTGTGTVNLEGDLNPGNSPAAVQFAGNVAFGSGAFLKIELAGSTPGAQYDQVHVTGQLSLNGELDVSLLGTYIPAVGTTFDILDWGSLAGTFFSLQLPTLTTGIWDTSQLYSTGMLSVVGSLAGDFNGNGIVDAADYVVWRNGFGTTYTQNDFNVWRTHFGQIAGSGAGTSANSAVPEPATLLMLIVAAAGWRLQRVRAA